MKYDYDCFKCNCKFNIQSDKNLDIPIDHCPFCGSKDIQ